MRDLAIVIPAFRKAFFYKAMQSLSDQTVKDFTVYIGDDCSPDNLESIVDQFRNKLAIKYTRFDTNIGSKNIVNQWKRCVELTGNEEWIWLFSDDDIAASTCVENFYQTKQSKHDKFDVYRFNTCVIDANDIVTSCTPVGPQIETSEEMAYHLLMGQRGNSMPDHIFRREVYNKKGGFVFTRFAQAADWATSILFSEEKGICIIPDSILFWRVSGQNISSLASKQKKAMIYGHLDFIHWLLNHFSYLKTGQTVISFEMIEKAARRNLINAIISHYEGFHINSFPVLFNVFYKDLRLSFKESIKSLLTILIHSKKANRKMFKLFTGRMNKAVV